MASLGLLLGPASHIVNRILHMDPELQGRLTPLLERRLRLQLTAPEMTVTVTFTSEGLTLAEAADEAADVVVTGTAGDLLAMARDPDAAGGRLRFEGDPAVAQQARRFFRELDVDWEEALADHLGDVAAHQIGRAVRGVNDWFRHGAEAAGSGVAEYLTEEQRQLPARPEVEAFLDDVDRLRADADRLEARIKHLERQRRPAE
ncbi:SCP2 sterol-binding domain-containing protein [Aquisalimonas sp.]|uniref:ubiquinone biosynthesis accessory factor UbiJ n=1 Tax=unclassified Aquisalimonas TaxID=2644645 RepID=UPI0025BEA08B|nr:SCP2 sterol-binding domain-containing protein [Aquisalimonas sp.]